MSGWGTLTGEAHYTLSSLAHSNDKDRRMGAFNVLGYNNPAMDKLLQDAAIEMDEAKRRGGVAGWLGKVTGGAKALTAFVALYTIPVIKREPPKNVRLEPIY
jgi:ABC-type transport system substrate-binding protein